VAFQLVKKFPAFDRNRKFITTSLRQIIYKQYMLLYKFKLIFK